MSKISSKTAAIARAKYVTALDERELAVRLMEAGHGVPRPVGMSIQDALRVDPKMTQISLRMARAAIMYFGERIAESQQPN